MKKQKGTVTVHFSDAEWDRILLAHKCIQAMWMKPVNLKVFVAMCVNIEAKVVILRAKGEGIVTDEDTFNESPN